MNKIEEIILRRRNKVLFLDIKEELKFVNKQATQSQVASLMKNLEDLGYTLSKEVVEQLLVMDYDLVNKFYLELTTQLKEYIGADVEYNPMYPNFPTQVEEMEDIELFFNALVHYWSFGELLPEYKKDERLPLFDNPEFKVIELGNLDELYEIRNNSMKAKTSLSKKDKDDLKILFKNLSNTNLPEEIPFKENVVVIARTLYESGSIEVLFKYLKTATDVLRFVVELCDGDTSLAANTKFKSFKRSERRLILQLLDNCGSIEEDMLRYRMHWIRLAERLHPGEYPEFKKAYVAFDKLRNNEKAIVTFNKKLEEALKSKNVGLTVEKLVKRPGEFARRLDHLLRIASNNVEKDYIVEQFEKVVSEVATPILLQVVEHFKYRFGEKIENESRVYFPKGQVSRVYCDKDEREKLDEQICNRIVKICEQELLSKYNNLEPLGKVYIDPELQNYIVPQSQRSASEALKVITRGSRLSIDKNAKAVRGFIWWTNQQNSRVDIDLSVAVLKKDFTYHKHISYTNLRDEGMRAFHSGDITNGGDANGKGVAEFLDFDIDSVLKDGGRYIIFQVYSFTQQPFNKLEHCMFGWMERGDVKSGEIFEPSTVEQKINLTQNSIVSVPVIFDCVEKEFIWLDVNMGINDSLNNYYSNNVENNLKGISAVCYGILNTHKPSMYYLAALHANSRGEITDNRNKADIIFSNDTTKPVQKLCIEVYDEDGELIETRQEERIRDDVKIITAFDVDYWQSLV